MSTMKSFRLNSIDIARIKCIQEEYEKIFGEKPTETEVIKMAISKLCPKVFIDEED